MKHALAVLILSISAVAQIGWGGAPAATFAQTISQCPTMTAGYFVCPVVPADGSQPFIAMSVAGYNSGAPFAVVSQGPQGQQGIQGVQGQQGAPGQSMPKSFTLTCLAGKGTVQSGFTVKCSWQ